MAGRLEGRVARFTGTVTEVGSQGTWPTLTVVADASGSSDPDGMIASYRFDFGDGTTVGPSRTAKTYHTYVAGNWNARC